MHKEIVEQISYLELISFSVGQRGSSSWSSYRVEISVCAIKYYSTPALGEEDCTMGRFLWDVMFSEILSVLVILCPGNFSAQVQILLF